MSEQDLRRQFLRKSVGTALASTIYPAANADALSTDPTANCEWRNKQPGMAYRRLGRTNLMISEIISGGDPIRTGNYEHLSLALEMGLNYLDMAPAYGDCEIAIGRFLGGSAKRDKVFLQTKVSAFGRVRSPL